MKKRRKMLSFEITAIDLILAISVIVLLLLYLTKFLAKNPVEESIMQPIERNVGLKYFERSIAKVKNMLNTLVTISKREYSTNKSESISQINTIECPYGIDNIRGPNCNKVMSEKCLGCDKLVMCYDENSLKTSH